MPIYVKNIPTKFHPDPILNNGAQGIFWRGRSNNNNKNNKTSSSNLLHCF